MMQKPFVALFEILSISILLAAPALTQPCADTVYLFDTTVVFDTTIVNQRIVRLPVILGNPCEIGGFNVVLTTSAPPFLAPLGGDTLGTRLNYHLDIDTIYPTPESMFIDTTIRLPWEFFEANPGEVYPNSLFAIGIANYPGPPETPPLDSGRGAIYYAKFIVPCDVMLRDNEVLDTIIQVMTVRAAVSDPVGFTNPTVYSSIGNVHLRLDPTQLTRGDANCNGERRGSDVTYLVGYFKGQAVCPCLIKAGDANGDGFISGGDVTFLVRYFKGTGPAPPN